MEVCADLAYEWRHKTETFRRKHCYDFRGTIDRVWIGN
jgi:hypothetical protein